MANIYVYDKSCEDFTNFGLCGALTPTSCVFEEEANGMSEITLEHPIDDFGRFNALTYDNLLVAEVPVRTTPEIDGHTIVTTVEKCTVKMGGITKAYRTIYRSVKNDSGRKGFRVLPYGAAVTVVQKYSDNWRKVKCDYGTGYMHIDGLDFGSEVVIEDKSQSIESVQPAWTVKPQIFRIYSVEKNIDTIKVSARHISYDLLYNITSYSSKEAVPCYTALSAIMNNTVSEHDFDAYTNLADTRVGLEWTRVNPINALLDPETGLTALYGAALVRDNWELYVLHDPGLNRGVTIEYAKNMTGLECTESTEDVVTRVIPVGEDKDGNDLLLSGTIYVDSPHINDYPVPHIQVLKCTDCKAASKKAADIAVVREKMKLQAQAVFDEGADVPEVEMSVDFVTLGDTAEYAQYKDLDRLFLWDYVIIRHKKLGLDVTARVASIKWDCITGRMESMEIGKVGKTLANSGITTWQIPSGFSGNKIATGTVGGNALASDIISTRHVQSESINADAIQANAVTSEKIVSGAVTADKIEAGSIDSTKIVAATITSNEIAAGTITGNNIASQTITAINIAGKTITADQLQAALITADCGLIEDGAIKTAQIADGSITAAKIVSLNADVIEAGTLKADRLLITGDDGVIYQINAAASGLSKTELAKDKYKEALNGTVIVAQSITAAQIAAATITGNEIAANTIKAANIDVATLFANETFTSSLYTSEIYGGKSLKMLTFHASDTAPTSADEGYRWLDTGVTPQQMRTWRGLSETPSGATMTTDRSIDETVEGTGAKLHPTSWTPIRSGSGTASASNVRALVGKTAAYGHIGKNLCHRLYDTNRTITQNGLTIVYDATNQTLTVSGTATGRIDLYWYTGYYSPLRPQALGNLEQGKKYTLSVPEGLPAKSGIQYNYRNERNSEAGLMSLAGNGIGTALAKAAIVPNTFWTGRYIFWYANSGAAFGDGHTFTVQFEEGNIATAWEPYDTNYAETVATLPETIYGGTINPDGSGTKTWEHIASYNGETLPGKWVSSMDTYSTGATPTTGAEVAYELATPVDFTATLTHKVQTASVDNTNNTITSDITITATAEDDSTSTATITVNGEPTTVTLTNGTGSMTVDAEAISYTITADADIDVSYTCSGWETVNDTTATEDKLDDAYEAAVAARTGVERLDNYIEITGNGLNVKSESESGNYVNVNNDGVDIYVNHEKTSSFISNGLVLGNYILWHPEESGGLAFNLLNK